MSKVYLRLASHPTQFYSSVMPRGVTIERASATTFPNLTSAQMAAERLNSFRSRALESHFVIEDAPTCAA